MRRLIAATCLALIACETERIELVGLRDAAVEDGGSEDSGVDTGVADTGSSDAAVEDSGAMDSGTPDGGSECACRYVMCRNDPDCERVIGAGHTCHPREFYCSGAIGTCTTNADCGGAEWMCTTSSVSLDPC